MAMPSTRKGFLMTLMIESPQQKTGTHILPPSSTSHTSTCATKRTTPLLQRKKTQNQSSIAFFPRPKNTNTHNPLSFPQLTPPLPPQTKTQSLKTKEHPPPTHNFLLLIHSKQQQPNKNQLTKTDLDTPKSPFSSSTTATTTTDDDNTVSLFPNNYYKISLFSPPSLSFLATFQRPSPKRFEKKKKN